MAKKTLEQLQADKDKLRLQLQAIEDQEKEIAESDATEARKVVDDAVTAYNKLAALAGKPALFLAPHRGATSEGGKRTRTTKPKGDVPADALNKALHHLQTQKGKAVSSTELGKAAGYSLVKGLLAEQIGDGTVKVSGAGRATSYAWAGK